MSQGTPQSIVQEEVIDAISRVGNRARGGMVLVHSFATIGISSDAVLDFLERRRQLPKNFNRATVTSDTSPNDLVELILGTPSPPP